MSNPPTPGATYEAAGVSIDAGDKAVELMKTWIDKARRPEMVGGIGGFAGLFDASALKAYDHPLLATSADGVGTKVAIAQAMDVHHTIGFDLVGMLVDDLVVCGAEPLFLTDYIATGRVVPERIAAIVQGIAEACVVAGCALLGGETAEHPGLLGPDEYDVAGSTTGVVEATHLLGPGRVRPGDLVVAMASSGLHSNGYSLVRHVLLGEDGAPAGAREGALFADMSTIGPTAACAIGARLAERGLRLDVRLEMGSTEAIKQAVAAGLGLAIVSRAAAADQLALGRIAIVPVTDLPLRRTLTQLVVPARASSPTIDAFERELAAGG